MNILRRNNVRIIGDAEQTMLLAHGYGCDQNVWRHLIKKFEPYFRIVVFDYVGAGKSDLQAYDSQKYRSLDGYAQDILDICEALDLSDCIFVGHSVSSMIGIRAALKQPAYFSKLVLVAPSPYYINEQHYIGGLEKTDLDDLLTMMDDNYLGWSGMIAPMVMGNADQPELGEELTESFCSTDPTIARQFARVTFLSDARGDLPRLTLKSLTLQCSNDILAPLAVGDYIKEHTPGNKLVVLAAQGHCPHLSAPEETAQAILSFVKPMQAVY